MRAPRSFPLRPGRGRRRQRRRRIQPTINPRVEPHFPLCFPQRDRHRAKHAQQKCQGRFRVHRDANTRRGVLLDNHPAPVIIFGVVFIIVIPLTMMIWREQVHVQLHVSIILVAAIRVCIVIVGSIRRRHHHHPSRIAFRESFSRFRR